ncbi:hypothetical protein [Marinomonas sp. THO17]|uniref:hypothetical protein n=1 Tax=Marinomonas sp. THO17 TaxID=3149048 RepID=UPI00336C09E0
MTNTDMSLLKTLLLSSSYQRATHLAIRSDELSQSLQAEAEWAAHNKWAGVGHALLVVLLGVVAGQLLVTLLGEMNIYQYVSKLTYFFLLVMGYLLSIVGSCYVLFKSFKVYQNRRLSLLSAHLTQKGLVFDKNIKLMTVEGLINLEENLVLAQQGDSNALLQLSLAILEGRYLKANVNMAMALAAVAADLNNSRAAYLVAQAFDANLDVKLSAQEAEIAALKEEQSHLFWLQRAAELGSYKAKSDLARKAAPDSLVTKSKAAKSTQDLVEAAVLEE